MIEQGGNVIAKVVKNRYKKTILPIICNNVNQQSVIDLVLSAIAGKRLSYNLLTNSD
jgi:hypothetical protein